MGIPGLSDWLNSKPSKGKRGMHKGMGSVNGGAAPSRLPNAHESMRAGQPATPVESRPSLRLENMGARSKNAITQFATPKEKLKIGLKLKPLPTLDAANQRVKDAMDARRAPKPLRLTRPRTPKTVSATPIDNFGKGSLRSDAAKKAGQAAYEAKKKAGGLGRLRELEAQRAARNAAAQRALGRKLNRELKRQPKPARSPQSKGSLRPPRIGAPTPPRPLASPSPAPRLNRLPDPGARGAIPTLSRMPVSPRVKIPQIFPLPRILPKGVKGGVLIDLAIDGILPEPLNSGEDAFLEQMLSAENLLRKNDEIWKPGQKLEIAYPWEDIMFSVRSPNNNGDIWSTFLISGTLVPARDWYSSSFDISQQYAFKPLVYSTEPWINRRSVITNDSGGPAMDMITATVVRVSGWQPEWWDYPGFEFPDIEWWVLEPPEEEADPDEDLEKKNRRVKPKSPPLIFVPPQGEVWPDFPDGIEIEPTPSPKLEPPDPSLEPPNEGLPKRGRPPRPRWRPRKPGKRWPGFNPAQDDEGNPWLPWDHPGRPERAEPAPGENQHPTPHGPPQIFELPPVLPTSPSQWRWEKPETEGGIHPPEPGHKCQGEECEMSQCRFSLVAIQRVTAAQHVETQAAVASNHTNTQTVIKADNATNKAGIISAILEALGQISLQSISSKLDDALGRLGPKLPNGGLSGKIERMAKFFHFEKIVNLLTLMTALHNAAMLSRSLASTLGEVASQLLNAVGIKDEEGQAIDVNETLSKSANDFMESLLGKSVWDGLQDNWKKANSIYQAGAQVIWSVRSLTDSMRDIAEWTASNTGRIGNALKKFRVVGENAYPWMNENVKAQGRWFQKIDAAKARIETYDEAASSFGGFLGAGIGAREEFEEAVEAKDRFTDLLEKGLPGLPKENEPVKDSAATAKAASQSPAIAPTDLPRAES